MAKVKGLTQKQKVFVYEYLRDFNGTKAAMAAGYPAKSASAIASENLNKPEIQKLIKDFQKKVEQQALISQDMIIRELTRYGFRWMDGSYGKITGSKEAIAALDKLGQHFGMWDKKDAGSSSDKDSRKNALKRISQYLAKRTSNDGGDGSE